MQTLQFVRPPRGVANGDCIGADGHKNHLIGCDGTKSSICMVRRKEQDRKRLKQFQATKKLNLTHLIPNSHAIFSETEFRRNGGTAEMLVQINLMAEVEKPKLRFSIELTAEERTIYERLNPKHEEEELPEEILNRKPDSVTIKSTTSIKTEQEKAEDRTPRKDEVWKMLNITQSGQDFTGLKEGQFLTVRDGKSSIAVVMEKCHIEPRKLFNDGRAHWWNSDGTPNFRIAASVVNDLEGDDMPWSFERDEYVKESVKYKYKVSSSDSMALEEGYEAGLKVRAILWE